MSTASVNRLIIPRDAKCKPVRMYFHAGILLSSLAGLHRCQTLHGPSAMIVIDKDTADEMGVDLIPRRFNALHTWFNVCVRISGEASSMIPPFDIFYLHRGCAMMPQGTADTLEIARLQVKTLMVTDPGEYVIRSQKTGHKMTIKADGTAYLHKFGATP